MRWRLATMLLSSAVAHAAHPCETPPHHALDFWLGTWVVKDGETHRADGRVRQASLASRDGQAWKPHYELHYSREGGR